MFKAICHMAKHNRNRSFFFFFLQMFSMEFQFSYPSYLVWEDLKLTSISPPSSQNLSYVLWCHIQRCFSRKKSFQRNGKCRDLGHCTKNVIKALNQIVTFGMAFPEAEYMHLEIRSPSGNDSSLLLCPTISTFKNFFPQYFHFIASDILIPRSGTFLKAHNDSLNQCYIWPFWVFLLIRDYYVPWCD